MNEKLPDIIICLNELSTTCVYQAVVITTAWAESQFLGYYDTDTILKKIRAKCSQCNDLDRHRADGAFCVDALRSTIVLAIPASILRRMSQLLIKE